MERNPTLARRPPKQILPRFHGFYYAAGVGVVSAIIAAFLVPMLGLTVGANLFFLTYLALTFWQMPHLTAEHLRSHAGETDAPVRVIFLVTIAVLVISAASLFILINSGEAPDPLRLVLAVLAVILSWFVLHTMAALHYAYEYYEKPDASPGKGRKSGESVVGGLEYPSGDEPDGVGFLYFAYVLGMTAQTSDVNVTSSKMRLLVMIHSVFSFFFNTVIVAATVNVVVSLGQ